MTKTVSLLTHTWDDVAPTGVGRYAQELRAALHVAAGGRGWSVTSASGPARSSGSGGNVHHLPGPRKLLQPALAAGLPLRWDRRLGRPDVVHQLNPWTPVPTRAPQLLTVHDLMPLTRPEWFARRHRWRFRAAVRWGTEHARLLVCDSRHVADLLVRLTGVPGERVEVVHCGIADRFRQPVDGDVMDRVLRRHGLRRGGYLLGLGVQSAREDPSVVVEALGRCRVELGERALVFTGPERHGAGGVVTAAAAAGLRERVHLAGFVPEDELVPLLAGAAALVHPSRDEGFGFTPLEAMAAGTPVITSAVGSLPEVTGGAAVLVDPDDPQAWADAIDSVVGDPSAGDELRRAGRRHQAAFTWEAAATSMLALYEQVVRSPR